MLTSIRSRFRNIARKQIELAQLQQLQDELLEESAINRDYLILIVGACAIATFGLLTNSTAVIIGAMIIAPLMLPIRGLAFGALAGNLALFRQSFIAVIVGTGIAIGLAAGLGWLTGISTFGSEVLSRSKPTLLDLGIAVAAGGISGYAKVQPKISASLAGTAIAVALMPPLCVVGLGLAHANWSLNVGAILLYLTNLLGITLSCMLTFLAAGYIPWRNAHRALSWTVALTGLLLLPLSASFAELVRQTRLESSLRTALLDRTVTFRHLELVDIDTNWLSTPPQVRLTVRSQERITPKQVRLLETFLEQEMGQKFALIFSVSQVEEVTRGSQLQPFAKPTTAIDRS
jgi:uncharacterized hydrophobic protein (TIGR00271 family)